MAENTSFFDAFALGCTPGGITGGGGSWVNDGAKNLFPLILKKNQDLGYVFIPGQRPKANAKGIIPTTMEWARRLQQEDIDILTGKAGFSEEVPDVDAGFTAEDMKDEKKREAITKVIQQRLQKAQQSHPIGYLVRHVPKDELKGLQQ